MPNLKPEFFQIIVGEDRVIPLRVDNVDGSPFSIAAATDLEVRFKKANNGALIKRMIPGQQITNVTVLNGGNANDINGAANAVVLYTTTGMHYFWFNVTDGTYTQVDPGLSGTSHQVDVLKADSISAVTTKLNAQIDAVIGFTTTVLSSTITVVNDVAGAVTAPYFSGAIATCNITVTTEGWDSAVTIINGVLGKLSVALSSADTTSLLIGERQTFTLWIYLPGGKRAVNYNNALTVSRQNV